MTITQKLIDNLQNFTKGRNGHSVQAIIIHTEVASKIDDTADRSLYHWFETNAGRVSAHYFVTFSGNIEQYVLDQDTAYQAGDLTANYRSIGIEHQDNGYPDHYTDAQYEASAQLIASLCKQYQIPAQYVDPFDPAAGTGITIHKNIVATGCPDQLDWQRIINRAIALVQADNAQQPAQQGSADQQPQPQPIPVPPQQAALSWGLGVNIRGAAFYGENEFPRTNLGTELDYLKGMGVKTVRFTASHIDFTPAQCAAHVESALTQLQQRGMNAIVTLTDAYSAMGMVIKADASWHNQNQNGANGQIDKKYWNQGIYRQPGSYLDFVSTIVSAGKNHPNVLVWELGNEFAILPQPASADDSDAFRQFVQEAAAKIKSIEPNALVSIGLISSHNVAPLSGDAGAFAAELYGQVDIVSVHCYDNYSDGDKQNVLADVGTAHSMQKPLLVGEMGKQFSNGNDRSGYYDSELTFWKGTENVFCVMPWQFDAQQYSSQRDDLGVCFDQTDFNNIVTVLKKYA